MFEIHFNFNYFRSRWNAATFVDGARLSNTLGGDDFARYKKHVINWQGQVLNLQTKQLQKYLDKPQTGICIDIVVPSYRCNNSYILRRILSLRASRHIYVRFWFIIDNPDEENLFSVKALANDMNSNLHENNYFVNVVHYGENRGASHARNVGYNYSTADWVLFIDDDVLVDDHLLDAYVGSIMRYPQAKVMVGYTEIPSPINLWTKVLKVSNIMHFYGIAQHRKHPPWGVTANMMVRGSRHNHTIQFKHIYPKTGGGEDIDFVFQVKEMYGGSACVVATPGAKALHSWWKNGMICYDQIIGWAWGDSLCLKEWSKKTFLVFPNWVEANMIILILLPFFWANLHVSSIIIRVFLRGLRSSSERVLPVFECKKIRKKCCEGCGASAIGEHRDIMSRNHTSLYKSCKISLDIVLSSDGLV